MAGGRAAVERGQDVGSARGEGCEVKAKSEGVEEEGGEDYRRGELEGVGTGVWELRRSWGLGGRGGKGGGGGVVVVVGV